MATAARTVGLSFASNAVGSTTIAGPLVGYKVGQVVLQSLAGGGGVAPVMHLAAHVYSIHSVAGAEKSAIAAVALVDEWIAPGATLDHIVEVPGGPLRVVAILNI